ncbi:MAG: tRNA (guanosine(46)-N7)-methyltransferase TrmB [Alphaproteobacteria bacterium]
MSEARRFVYGRRKTHKLRAGRKAQLEAWLPRNQVALPDDPSARLDPRGLFPAGIAAVWLEIGFGGGEHLAAQAAAHPGIGFIGCEPFVNGVASLARHAEEAGLGNLRVFVDDARLLLPRLEAASIGRAFVLYPDPWPKLRHHKRRIVNPETVGQLAALLEDGAELRLATDHPGYARWMLYHLTRHPAFAWLARGPSDWRERPADWPATRYEEKAIRAGRRPYYFRFERLQRQRNRADARLDSP